MTTISNLPFTRFVMQVSTGSPRIKSNWKAMQASNLETLKSPVWREVSTKDASLVDHDFTKSSHINDSYDAFQMTGNYDSTAMTEIAYAGMVAYRFKLPDDYYTGNANITSISVPVYRDRFCRGGVRVAVLFDGQTPPSAWTWDYVRGDSGAMSSKTKRALMAQNTVPYLTASSASDVVAEFTEIPPFQTKSRYLWIMLSIEDYEDGWEMYSAKEKRFYAIEGSARLGGDILSVEFDSDVTPDRAEHEYAIIRGGVVPKLPEGSASGARALELFRTGDRIVPSFVDSTTDPAYTVIECGGRLTEFYGQASDVNVSIPVTLGGVETRIIGICGNFDRASVPGVPGLVLVNAATGAIMQATVSGTIAATAAALVHTAASRVGVTIYIDNDIPHAHIYACDDTSFTNIYFLDIDLSTMVATCPFEDGANSSVFTLAASQKPLSFYDVSLIPGSYGNRGAPLLVLNSVHVTEDYASYGPGILLMPVESMRNVYGNNANPNVFGLCIIIGVDQNPYTISCNACLSGYVADGIKHYELSLVSSFTGLKRVYDGYVILAESNGCARITALYKESTTIVPFRNALAFEMSPGVDTAIGFSLDPVAYGSDDYLVYGNFYEAAGDPSLRYAFNYNATLSTRTALGAPCAPYKVFTLGNDVCVVRPRVGIVPRSIFLPDAIPSEPTAVDSALGLRTLQGMFYLGEAEAVARQTRERMGAAYSVRAGTRTLSVVSGGMAQDTSVPVWRIFASAFVAPFVVPTEWRPKTLRLDWTGWTGTATAGAQFNVWLRAGHWQNAYPQVLESDIPYDTFKAEHDGWLLLGSVDAMLSGSNRTASFDLAGLIGSEKIASLMLTAYASTDGINPGANTEWPVGAATEVDVVDGDIVNADKAWLPNVTLIG